MTEKRFTEEEIEAVTLELGRIWYWGELSEEQEKLVEEQFPDHLPDNEKDKIRQSVLRQLRADLEDEKEHCSELKQQNDDLITDLAAAQAKATKWTPVSERLPEKEGSYLVTNTALPTNNGFETSVADSTDRFTVISFFNLPDKSWDVTNDGSNIIAWAELPAPYEPEGK